ncbi:MAG TPA: DNA mismatch repair endonuclease MutL [Polyangiaceae bacterium]|nr:DNA mismatch repair endonuclease MutL [Polyangiaceae bacterium]
MPRILVLPPELASQIAAGEVVERPASVVKELCENAVDAAATRCDVEIEGGGIHAISVADDGEGMTPEDAERALERHATSKLARFEDLERLASYGFRGEALPSIASVSRLTLRTRTRDADAGVELVCEPGAARVARPAAHAPGTRVEVRDLFFNVPARRKFLRSSGTESGHVSEVVEAAALARPDLTFTLARDGRRVREYLRARDREERVRNVCSDDELAACRGERGPLRIEAFLSRPEAARAGAAGLRLLVNGRPVRDRALLVAIAQAYGSVLERGRYPRGVVYLDLPSELVDVNVHPQKAEVRFADPRAVSDALYAILSRALTSAFSLPTPERAAWGRRSAVVKDANGATGGAAPPVTASDEPGAAGAEERPADDGAAYAERAAPYPGHASSRATLAVPHGTDSASPGAAPLPAGAPRAPELADARAFISVRDSAAAPIQPSPSIRWSMLRFVAQLRQTFLLCEGDEGLYVLDQHAAAERVTFTRLRREYQSRAVPSQALLFPSVVDVTPAEAEIVEQRGAEIAEVGLDVRVRGPESVSIHAVPRLLQRASAERLVRDLLSEVSRSGGRAFSAAVDLALATMACHGSVRAGDPLSATEAKALLVALDQADFAGHCPHGRPVVTFQSWAELERKVGRR